MENLEKIRAQLKIAGICIIDDSYFPASLKVQSSGDYGDDPNFNGAYIKEKFVQPAQILKEENAQVTSELIPNLKLEVVVYKNVSFVNIDFGTVIFTSQDQMEDFVEEFGKKRMEMLTLWQDAKSRVKETLFEQ